MAKIVSPKQLITQSLNHSITRQHKIVLATGCFDILHQGHKFFLKTAKKQGDVLIVGLESDKRVKELKGNARPINSWKKRAKVLAELSGVDFIFPLPKKFNDSKDHFELLQLIKPNVLAVSENTPYLEKKKKLIEKIGGKIFIYTFNSEYSTTKLLDLGA